MTIEYNHNHQKRDAIDPFELYVMGGCTCEHCALCAKLTYTTLNHVDRSSRHAGIPTYPHPSESCGKACPGFKFTEVARAHAPNCGIYHYADDLAECDCGAGK